jgi:hypothetical protein
VKSSEGYLVNPGGPLGNHHQPTLPTMIRCGELPVSNLESRIKTEMFAKFGASHNCFFPLILSSMLFLPVIFDHLRSFDTPYESCNPLQSMLFA